MWFLPSYGRPAALKKFASAPGGVPSDIVVICNEDDPTLPGYHAWSPWPIELAPAGSRLGDIWRSLMVKYPDEAFYGFLGDDHEPITPGWHTDLIEAAGKTKIAYPNDQQAFPVFRGICVVGGDLARAMGTLCPPGIRHNYHDNFLETIGRTFGLMVAMKDVIVLHRHPLFDVTIERDATYQRGSSDIDQDRLTFEAWLNSNDRLAMNERVGKAVGIVVKSHDFTGKHVVVLTPNGRSEMHVAYYRSMRASGLLAQKHGLKISEVMNGGASHIGKAREWLLWRAYYDTDATHFLFIDNDMEWEPRLPMHLLAADHEVVAVVGRKKTEEVAFACNFLSDPQHTHPESGFLEIKECGGAFLMIERSVIARMMEAYPDLRYNTGPGGRPEYALFLDMLDRTHPDHEFPDRLSEDLSFCRRWRAMGGEIYIDHESELTHWGEKGYKGAVQEKLTITEKPQPAPVVAAAE